MEKVWHFILENFVSIAKESEEFLQMNVDDFLTIITDELLNVKVCKITNFKNNR